MTNKLEEAANKYIKGNYSPWLYKAMFDCFKAGAEWQKQQTIDKAAEWFEKLTGLCSFVNDFKKYIKD